MRHTLEFVAAGRWLLRIRQDGTMELNAEIPQSDAVREFVFLCSAKLREVQNQQPIEYILPHELHAKTDACEREGCIPVRRCAP